MLLVLLAPALLVMAALVRLTSPGPALLRQQRGDRGERLFVFWKFRTMCAASDDEIHGSTSPSSAG